MEDSIKATMKHKEWVKDLMGTLIDDMVIRSIHHDDSKMEDPEKSLFDEYSPKLKDCTYGSDEYKEFLKCLKPALDHHYAVNSHHPEHYENGINDMDLVDLIELTCDWIASSKRHADGNIYRSISLNKDRFGMSDQLCKILENTVNHYFKDVLEKPYDSEGEE